MILTCGVDQPCLLSWHPSHCPNPASPTPRRGPCGSSSVDVHSLTPVMQEPALRDIEAPCPDLISLMKELTQATLESTRRDKLTQHLVPQSKVFSRRALIWEI